jgi:anti-sigma B factor antagonist
MDETKQFSVDELGGILIISISGKIDASSSDYYEEELKTRIDSGIKKIILNMAQLSYISSAGLRTILVAQKRIKQSGGIIVLTDMQSGPADVFKMTGFDRLFPVFDSVDDAINFIKTNKI